MIDPAELAEVFARSETIFAQTGYPPGIDLNLWSPHAVASLGSESISGLLSDIPDHDEANPVERAAIANLLAHSPAVYIPHEGDGPLEYLARPALLEYLRSVLPSIDTLSVLRWELHAAGVARDLERVKHLGALWDRHDPELKWLHFVPRALFMLLIEAKGFDWQDGAWDFDVSPRAESNVFQFSNLLILGQACNVMDVDLLLPTSQARTSDRCEIPLLCLSHIERLGPQRAEAIPEMVAIAAWCKYAVGVLHQNVQNIKTAALLYATLSARQETTGPLLLTRCHMAASQCFADAADFVAAERHAREWVALAPDDPAPQRRLAESLYKQHRIPDAIEAIEHSLRLTDESDGENWKDSLLLQLGLEHLDDRRVAGAIESAALKSSFREQGTELVEWMTPWVTKLSPPARGRWWIGLYTLTSATLREHIGESGVFEQAGDALGEAVSLELRHSVFSPWLAQTTLTPAATRTRPWETIGRGKATLGHLIEALLQTRNPATDTGQSFAKWLWHNKPKLAAHVKNKPASTFERLVHLRGAAQHDTVSADDARVIYEVASAMLQVVVE